MNKQTKARLERAGWRVGDAQDFLGLSDEEAAFIELRLVLANQLREVRQRLQATQAQVAQMIHSSQSRVAKMEACDPSVSSDLLLKALIALGVSFKDLGRAVAKLDGPVGTGPRLAPTPVKPAATKRKRRATSPRK